VNDSFGRMCKGAVVTYFNAPFGGTEENIGHTQGSCFRPENRTRDLPNTQQVC
jgi:hypothetical protein